MTTQPTNCDKLRIDHQRLIDAVAELRHAHIEYARTHSKTAETAVARATRRLDALLQELTRPRLL